MCMRVCARMCSEDPMFVWGKPKEVEIAFLTVCFGDRSTVYVLVTPLLGGGDKGYVCDSQHYTEVSSLPDLHCRYRSMILYTLCTLCSVFILHPLGPLTT